MTSRHRTRTTYAQQAEDALAWTSNNEPEPGHPRQAMASTQRHNTEQAHGDGHRKHRSKRAETADTVAPSSSAPVTSHNKSSSKQRSSTLPSTSYQGAYPSMHTMAGGVPVAATSTSAPTPYYAGDTSRAHMKTRADKPSPRSSNERITLPDDRSARRARTAHPAMAAVQAPSSTQYYVDPPQVAGETSSRHRRERDKERDKERERERRREEKARARLQEAESLRTQEKKERDRERRKEREPEPERASRDRDGHRSTERTKERESSRRKEERRAAEKAAAPAASSSTAAHRTPQTDDRPTTSSARYAAQSGQPAYPTAQQAAVPSGYAVPGTSTNYYDPNVPPAAAYRRPSDPAPMAVPQRTSERDKNSTRQHRSHRDRVAGQGSGQESGMSSSEQEQSLRDRYRPSERRHATKERKDVHAPSGSETERDSTRDRRKLARTHAEIPGHAKPANEAGPRPTEAQQFAANYKASRLQQQAAPPPQDQSYRPTGTTQLSAAASAYPSGQPTVPVGLTSQRHIPQIVSIRAGQGPADPQTPVMIPKSSSSATVYRQHEQGNPDSSHHHEPHSYATPSAEHASYGGDTSRKSRPANPGAQPPNSQQVTYGETPYINAYSSNANTGSLHPVQQAIRSVEGIVRPPSTRPGGKPSSSAVPTSQAATTDPSPRYGSSTRDYERAYAQKSTTPGTGAYGQTAQQPHSTPQYSTSDIRLPGAYPSSPAVAPPVHPGYGSAQGYGVPGVATTSGSHDEKTPRARPVELSVQYQTSTYPHVQNGVAPDNTKMPSVFSPAAHSITVAQATFGPARPPSAAPEAKTQWSSVPAGLSSPPPTRNVDTRTSQDVHANQQGVGGHSPGRQSQNHIGRSPGVTSTAQLDATPRQHPSSHLPTHRNGSSDTIQQSGASKYSPSLHNNQQSLNHRTSIGSLQPHASSRPDMTPNARPNNVLSGYPEPPTRYRSPAPIPIPYRGPSSVPNPSTPASQSLNVSSSAPAYETCFMSPRGASATIAPPHSASTRGHQQAADYDLRTQDPYNTSGQRPPRAAPPSTPSAGRQQYDVTSPDYVQSVLPPPSAPPRSSTFPAQQTRRPPDANPVHPSSHSRSTSEPHYPVSGARAPLAVQTNTAHIKSRSATHAAAAASDQDLLLTPSSLAPSMLPRQHSNASSFLPPGARGAEHKLMKDKDKDKDKERKRGGFFSGINLFRSRSNPPRPLQETVPDNQRDMRTRKRQDSAPAPSNMRQEPASAPSTMRLPPNAAASTLLHARQDAYDKLTLPRRREQVDMPAHVAPPTPTPRVEYLTVPSAGMGVPSHSMPTSSGRSPTKMFSPFRLLSKRHRTVSAASVEAVDGTAANTVTGADSTRSSTAGRLSPPLRDPQTATQEWRNNEEADFVDRGTRRRRRPGVTFDVDPDAPEKTTAPRAPSKGPRQRQPVPMQEQ